MRELGLDIQNLPCCCKVDVISDFGTYITRGKRITDEEWLDALCGDNSISCSLITFAHSSRMNTGPCTPKAFALWLESRGETVMALKGTTRGRNAHITLYTCELSKKFRKDLKAYEIKKEQEENAKYVEQLNRGALAA